MPGELIDLLDERCLHVCVDLQRLFAEPTDWHTPALAGIVPAVTRLVAPAPERTVFTRFLTPVHPDEAGGVWRRYYRRWSSVTLERMAPEMLDLVDPLPAFVPPAGVCDKTTHSAFNSGPLRDALARQQPGALVVSGVETDVCVLATVLDAVDLGYAVIVAGDAVASSSLESHRAILNHVFPRLDEQVQVVPVDAILCAWGRR